MSSTYKFKDYIFVLWGNGFDSLATAIFVTQLRKAGLRVKLVALSRRNIRGTQGLTLLPDMTLEQALPLIKQVSCLIIPPHRGNKLLNDPRIEKLIEQIDSALFVSPFDTTIKIEDKEQITYTPTPDYQDLISFSKQLSICLMGPSL